MASTAPRRSRAPSPPGGPDLDLAAENERLRAALAEHQRLLAQAHERQTATAEILRVIASSPTDEDAVMDAIVQRAVRLCGAADGALRLIDGNDLVVAASAGGALWNPPRGARAPLVSGSGSPAVAIRARRAHVIQDTRTVDTTRHLLAERGVAAILNVPLLRRGEPIGVITVNHGTPDSFAPGHIALLESFAAQAVIAIENARLFSELNDSNATLKEALEQQTASGEILRAIASSPADLQRVLDTIVASAARLCDAAASHIQEAVDGSLVQRAVVVPEHMRLAGRFVPPGTAVGPVQAGHATGEALLQRRTIHVPDTEGPAGDAFPVTREHARIVGFRAIAATPLLRQGEAYGALAVSREAPQPFNDSQLALLESFADQAVIAIENARLFQQLQHANHTLTERTQQLEGALAQQTATSDVLRVIASSPNDRRAALEAVVERAARLCGADNATVRLVEGDEFVVAANYPADLLPGMIGRRQRLGGDGLHERALRSGRTIHLPDTAADPLERHRLHRSGQRTAAAVPLLREGIPVGVLNARRTEQRPFTELELAALETFAAQAAIAVENTRLFGELRERDDRRRHELERAASIQRRLLPSSIEGWPGVLEIAHRFRPAVETSGDFFDVLPLTPSQPGALPPLQLAVGDVAGKGMSAALVTALARTALHASASVPTGLATPASTLRIAGQRLHRDVGSGHFVACALGVVEPPGLHNAGPLLRLANAAQVPVLLVRDGRAEEVEPSGYRLPLGAQPDGAYDDAKVELRPRDVVLFSSDGLVEAPALPGATAQDHLPPPEQPGGLFGFARLAASASHWSSRAPTAEGVAAGVWSDLTAWCGEESHHDDMTLLVLRVPPAPAQTAR